MFRAAATEDPRGFLELYSPPVIFDEVQYAPRSAFLHQGKKPTGIVPNMANT